MIQQLFQPLSAEAERSIHAALAAIIPITGLQNLVIAYAPVTYAEEICSKLKDNEDQKKLETLTRTFFVEDPPVEIQVPTLKHGIEPWLVLCIANIPWFGVHVAGGTCFSLLGEALAGNVPPAAKRSIRGSISTYLMHNNRVAAEVSSVMHNSTREDYAERRWPSVHGAVCRMSCDHSVLPGVVRLRIADWC
jgi:hypothetical protein